MAHRGVRHAALRADEAGRSVDPRTGREPYAAVQLRQDNLAGDHYSLVGFQTQIKWGEQARVLRLIPGLEQAEFVRFGMVHRNTYVNGPTVLSETWQVRGAADAVFRGPDVRRRRVRRVGRVRPDCRAERGRARAGASRRRRPPRTTAIGALRVLRVARRSRRTTSRRTSRSASWSRCATADAARSALERASWPSSERALADLERMDCERASGAATVGARPA